MMNTTSMSTASTSNALHAQQKTSKSIAFMAGSGKVELSVSTVKNYLVSGDASKVTDQECVMYINMCKFNGLNPWLKEAYLIKYGSSPATMVPSKEAFTKRAERNQAYDGKEAGIVVLTGDGQIEKRDGCAYFPDALGEQLLGGWARVWRKDQSHPTYAEVSLNEYDQHQSKWKSAPATMIRKVALVQALREAFPSDLGGMYSAEEQGVTEPDVVIEHPVELPPEASEASRPATQSTSSAEEDPFAKVEG